MKQKKRILLVDNAKMFRETRREFLEQAGYEVVEAADPEEARAAILARRPDLAIIDVRLREDTDDDDWSGLQLARDLSPQAPILLVSAYREKIAETVRARLLPQFDEAAVAVGFHTKQEGPSAMLDMVADLLKYPAAGRATPTAEARQSIFLAYGHNEAARKAVGDFLRDNGLKVLELGQVAQHGDSILGNVERYISQAQFAVVLFTADDEGYARRDGPVRVKKRPRQNVVFELGYLLAKLGQRRVRVLVEGDLEIPTNYLGMLYIPMDVADNWQKTLARELRLSGVNINLRNVLQG